MNAQTIVAWLDLNAMSMIGWLAQNTVVAALLAVVVAVVVRAAKPSPAVRHLLWLLVIVKLVVPPVVCWPGVAAPAAPGAAPTMEEAQEMPEEPVERGSVAWLLPEGSAPEPGSELEAEEPPVPGAGLAAAAVSPARRLLDWGRGAMNRAEGIAGGLVWIAALGAAAVLLLQAIRMVRFARMVQAAGEAPDWLADLAMESARAMGVRAPAVRVSPRISSAFVWGAGAPVLLVSKRMVERMERARWEAIVMHEVAHIRRRDHWVGWLEVAAGCLYWWNPVFWWARARMHESAELACDAWVLKALPTARRAYAEALIDVSEIISVEQASACALGMGTKPRVAFERRLAMILCNEGPRTASRWGMAAVLLIALAVLPAWPQEGAVSLPDAGEPTAGAVEAASEAPGSGDAPAQKKAGRGSIASILDAPVSLEFDEPQHLAKIMEGLHEMFGLNIAIDWRVVEAPPAPAAAGEAQAAPEDGARRRSPLPGHAVRQWVPRKVPGMVQSFKLVNMPLGAALAGLLRSMGLDYSVESDFIWISTSGYINNEPFGAPEINVPEGKRPELFKALRSPMSLVVDEPLHLSKIVTNLAETYGINVVVDARVVEEAGPAAAQVSASGYMVDGILPAIWLSDTPMQEALKPLLRGLGLAYSVEDGFIWISTPELIEEESFGAPGPAGPAAEAAADPSAPDLGKDQVLIQVFEQGYARISGLMVPPEIADLKVKPERIRWALEMAIEPYKDPEPKMIIQTVGPLNLESKNLHAAIGACRALHLRISSMGATVSDVVGQDPRAAAAALRKVSVPAPTVPETPAPDPAQNQILVELLEPGYARVAGKKVSAGEVQATLAEAAGFYKDSKPTVMVRTTKDPDLGSKIMKEVVAGSQALGLNVIIGISRDEIDDEGRNLMQWGEIRLPAPGEPPVPENIQRSRMSANESGAAGAMRTIATGEIGFQVAGFVDADGNGTGDYGTLAQLANPDGAGKTPPFIDSRLGSGEKHGYRFSVTVMLGGGASGPAFSCIAEPAEPGKTGNKRFFVDQTGVIRCTSDGSEPNKSSPPLK